MYGEHIADKMMGRALALSAERSVLDSLVSAKALLVGGIAPTEIVAGMRLRARELDFIADVHEIRYRHERGC